MNIQCVIIKGYFETLDKNIFSASSSTILQDFLAVYKRWRIIDIIFVAIGRTLIMINLINLAIVNIYNPQKRNPKLQSFSFNKVPRLREFFRHTLRENGIILQEGRERIWVESLPPAPFSWWQPGPACPPPIQGRIHRQNVQREKIYFCDKIKKDMKTTL